MLTCQHLTIGYPDKTVQQDLNFSLREGELVCMLGPNGGGKSTLLRTLANLQPALEGEIVWQEQIRGSLSNQKDLNGEKSGFVIQNAQHQTANASFFARLVSIVLTERMALDRTTVHDVVAMGRYPYTSFLGGLTDEDERIIHESLAQVHLLDYEGRMFASLSDGESQRCLIAKALAQQTPVILLDEPTAHLDLPNRVRILQLLRRLAQEKGKTILISTHELDLALHLSDRILLLSKEGVQLDTAAHLLQTDAFTRAFEMDILHPLEGK